MKPTLFCCGAAFWVAHVVSAAGPASGPQPATVENARPEAMLATITLTAKAEQRLGIALVPVERKTVPRTRLFGGELLLPSGHGEGINSVVPANTSVDLMVLAERQSEADSRVNQTKVELEAASVALDRAKSLLKGKVGTEKLVDEARARFDIAQAAVKAEEARRKLLGAPIAETIAEKRMWIRVPVYVGDVARLEPNASAQVRGLADPPGSPALTAKSIQVPLSAAGGAATVDLFYELIGGQGEIHPGQKVGVTLPLKTAAEALVVPWDAVLADIYGGHWVYVNTADHTYERRRVEVRYVIGNEAVLARGPDEGSRVVTTGSAELFGTEFGTGK